jgi:hypothetical protein
MKHYFKLAVFLLSMAITYNAQAQGVLNKIKNKANQALEKAADKALGKEIEKQTGIPMDDGSGGSNSSGKPRNKGGAGLTNTEPPDVMAQMGEAEQAHKAANFSNSRFALQQALMGVEIQLGKELLKSLPKNVAGLGVDSSQDRVMSTQWGWSNLNIQRVYTDKKDKQLTIGIGNAGIYGGMAQMYFANAAMMQSTDEKQNFKNVMVKGNKGIIQYDESSGYSLLIGIGQSSGIYWECINFATEKEVMDAANSFDIDHIKKILGEQ